MSNCQSASSHKAVPDAATPPMSEWLVWLPFVVAYLLFFVFPIFLAAHEMQFFKYVPPRSPIGLDLRQTLEFSSAWLQNGSPYVGANNYPPLSAAIFAPLLALDPSIRYRVFTWLNILAFLFLAFYVPMRLAASHRVSPTFVLVLVTGLLSYGLHFELERGQFNVLAMLLCFAAIWVYRQRPGARLLAYALFILAVQLKLYPFIFIVMLIHDWRDWRNNARRLALLALANLGLLFVLGPRVFADFVYFLRFRLADVVSTTNHSIQSFVHLALQFLTRHGGSWLNAYETLVDAALLLAVGVCLVILVLLSVRQRSDGAINPYLLLACTLGALVIPAISQDYTLSILVAPMAVLVLSGDGGEAVMKPVLRIACAGLTAILWLAYASTLFSYTNKPHFLSNNFPALFVMLLSVTALGWLKWRGSPASQVASSFSREVQS